MKVDKYLPGMLNAFKGKGDITSKEVDGGFFKSIDEVVGDNDKENLFKKGGPYRGIVLRVDGQKSAGGTVLERIQSKNINLSFTSLKVRIPELHMTYPVNDNMSSLEIDLYPSFVARDRETSQEQVSVGDIVWVDFEDNIRFTGGYYISKVENAKDQSEGKTYESGRVSEEGGSRIENVGVSTTQGARGVGYFKKQDPFFTRAIEHIDRYVQNNSMVFYNISLLPLKNIVLAAPEADRERLSSYISCYLNIKNNLYSQNNNGNKLGMGSVYYYRYFDCAGTYVRYIHQTAFMMGKKAKVVRYRRKYNKKLKVWEVPELQNEVRSGYGHFRRNEIEWPDLQDEKEKERLWNILSYGGQLNKEYQDVYGGGGKGKFMNEENGRLEAIYKVSDIDMNGLASPESLKYPQKNNGYDFVDSNTSMSNLIVSKKIKVGVGVYWHPGYAPAKGLRHITAFADIDYDNKIIVNLNGTTNGRPSMHIFFYGSKNEFDNLKNKFGKYYENKYIKVPINEIKNWSSNDYSSEGRPFYNYEFIHFVINQWG